MFTKRLIKRTEQTRYSKRSLSFTCMYAGSVRLKKIKTQTKHKATRKN